MKAINTIRTENIVPWATNISTGLSCKVHVSTEETTESPWKRGLCYLETTRYRHGGLGGGQWEESLGSQIQTLY